MAAEGEVVKDKPVTGGLYDTILQQKKDKERVEKADKRTPFNLDEELQKLEQIKLQR